MFAQAVLLLMLVVSQVRQFQVVGETGGTENGHLRWAQIESIDRRFVDYTDIDFNGVFGFKKVPEGIYKITVGGDGVREQQRTFEVRPAFADARGRVAVKIEIKDGAAKDRLKVGVTSLAVSPKAIEEMRRAYD